MPMGIDVKYEQISAIFNFMLPKELDRAVYLYMISSVDLD